MKFNMAFENDERMSALLDFATQFALISPQHSA